MPEARTVWVGATCHLDVFYALLQIVNLGIGALSFRRNHPASA